MEGEVTRNVVMKASIQFADVSPEVARVNAALSRMVEVEREVSRGTENVRRGLEATAGEMVKATALTGKLANQLLGLTRGFALLTAAREEDLEKALRLIASIEGTIIAVRSMIGVLDTATKTWKAYAAARGAAAAAEGAGGLAGGLSGAAGMLGAGVTAVAANPLVSIPAAALLGLAGGAAIRKYGPGVINSLDGTDELNQKNRLNDALLNLVSEQGLARDTAIIGNLAAQGMRSTNIAQLPRLEAQIAAVAESSGSSQVGVAQLQAQIALQQQYGKLVAESYKQKQEQVQLELTAGRERLQQLKAEQAAVQGARERFALGSPLEQAQVRDALDSVRQGQNLTDAQLQHVMQFRGLNSVDEVVRREIERRFGAAGGDQAFRGFANLNANQQVQQQEQANRDIEQQLANLQKRASEAGEAIAKAINNAMTEMEARIIEALTKRQMQEREKLRTGQAYVPGVN